MWLWGNNEEVYFKKDTVTKVRYHKKWIKVNENYLLWNLWFFREVVNTYYRGAGCCLYEMEVKWRWGLDFSQKVVDAITLITPQLTTWLSCKPVHHSFFIITKFTPVGVIWHSCCTPMLSHQMCSLEGVNASGVASCAPAECCNVMISIFLGTQDHEMKYSPCIGL